MKSSNREVFKEQLVSDIISACYDAENGKETCFMEHMGSFIIRLLEPLAEKITEEDKEQIVETVRESMQYLINQVQDKL